MIAKKNLLLLDTNLSAAPIYQHLKAQGNHVYVVGGNPKDYLAKVADNYINADYSDTQTVSRLFVDLNCHLVIPGCNDLSYEICSKLHGVVESYVDPLNIFAALHNKRDFRQLCSRLELLAPKSFSTAQQAVAAKKTVIIKPGDAFSGKGVSVVKSANENDIRDAITTAIKASRSETYTIEEFIDGQLYSHSAFLKDGKIAIDFLVEEHCIACPFAVDTSFVLDQKEFSISAQEMIRSEIGKIVEHLKLENGLIHTQFIFDGNKTWLLELARRCPGDLYSELIKLSTGFDYAAAYANSLTGKSVRFDQLQSANNLILRHTFTTNTPGKLEAIQVSGDLNLVNLYPLMTSGDFVGQAPKGRVAIGFFKTGNKKMFQDTVRFLNSSNFIRNVPD